MTGWNVNQSQKTTSPAHLGSFILNKIKRNSNNLKRETDGFGTNNVF